MKAIILAAGEGSRLRPYTNDKPKCLVEYKGRPIIDYTLEALRACGIDDIVVITGYKSEVFIRSGVREYTNALYASTNMVHTLFCAEAEMTDDLVISYGDIIFDSAVLPALVASPADVAVVVDK